MDFDVKGCQVKKNKNLHLGRPILTYIPCARSIFFFKLFIFRWIKGQGVK